MRFIIIISITLMMNNCASTSAPTGWLPTAEESVTNPRGGWIEIEHMMGTITSGELISIQEDSIFLFPLSSQLVSIPIDKIKSAKLAKYDSQLSKITQWAGLGTLSTLSHGFGLLFSAPVWIITGLWDGRKNSRSAILEYPDVPLSDFSKFARFPQGIPAALDRSTLRSSNYH